MKLLRGDEVSDAIVLSGNSDIAIFSKQGNVSFYNENEIAPTGIRTSGVKAMSLRNGDEVIRMYAMIPEEKAKFVLFTDRGCQRIFDSSYLTLTARLGKLQNSFKCFKSDPHNLVFAKKIVKGLESVDINLVLDNHDILNLKVTDFKPTQADKYAKKNMDELSDKNIIVDGYVDYIEYVDDEFKALKGKVKLPEMKVSHAVEEQEDKNSSGYEQISIFDDLGD